MVAVIAAATIVPWGLALLMLLVPRARPLSSRLTPLAALPAAVVAIVALGQSAEVDWLFLGTRVGVDETAAVFLLLGSAVWTAAGTYAHSYLAGDKARHRFNVFFLATMGAQLGLATAQDASSFYLLFWVMTISAYGLVVHDGSRRARRAGRAYLVMAMLGEGFLLPGILLAVGAAGSTELLAISQAVAVAPHRDALVGLFLIGFAVKAGLPPLHFWLPLAHPAAPVPASAVLSGLLIKAGLLGWLRFLPLGNVDLPEWGGFLVSLGILAALLGAAIGTTQKDPKSALAYSSVSQMGWMALIVGLGLGASGAWEGLLPILLLFVAHHGLAKSALFLGVGVSHSPTIPRVAVVAGLVLPALSLAGAPLTNGASLKSAIKSLLYAAPDPLPLLLPGALTVATFGTVLVLGRAILLLLRRDTVNERKSEAPAAIRAVAWGGLVLVGVLLPAFWSVGPLGSTASLPAIALAVFTIWTWNRLRWPVPPIPPGDILSGIERLARGIHLPKRLHGPEPSRSRPLARHFARFLGDAEIQLARASGLTLLYVGLLAILVLAASRFP